TNRVEDISKTAGGKGLNVARVLQQLDEDVAATGLLGGSLGTFIRSQINALGIQDLFVDIAGDTRNCIGVLHEGQQTEILESGPTISSEEEALFIDEYSRYLKRVDLVTMSGSLPKGLPDHFYAQLIELANDRELPVLLDIRGSVLRTTVESASVPFIIKPNEEEFADIPGKEHVQESEIIDALASEPFKDIPWVVVTLGSNGAIIKSNKNIYNVNIPTVQAVNPVGSGDSVIAGFASGLVKNMEDEELIQYSLSMGVLNSLEEKTGYINSVNVPWM